jgi:rubrerythrin
MFFSNNEIRTKIHMRYLFQIAILIEEQGIEFYNKFAEQSSDVNVKKLCSKLASDEAKHKKLFKDALSRWLPPPADNQSMDSLIQELKNAGPYSDEPPLDTSERDMIEYAIEQENKTADFYLSFKKAFKHEWKNMQIYKLAMTERKHASDLMSLLSKITK